jgi:hypothetical protein
MFNDFIKQFRPEVQKYVEYSFGHDADSFGSMIVSADPGFLSRVYSFYDATGLKSNWKEEVEKINDYIKGQLFYLKADWNKNVLQTITLYFRLSNLIAERTRLFEDLGNDLLGHLKNTFNDYPLMLGMRIGINSVVAVSWYYRIDNYRKFISDGKLMSLSSTLNISGDLTFPVVAELHKLSGANNNLWVGLEFAGDNDKVSTVKLDLEEVGISKGIDFLKSKNEPASRLRNILEICHNCRKDHFGYFALKFNRDGVYTTWKCYLGNLQGASSEAANKIFHRQ